MNDHIKEGSLTDGREQAKQQEDELLRRARALDELALGAIYDRYYEPLYRYLYHHIGHTTTAEDLAAEVFTRLLKQLSTGRGPQQYLKAWLYRVAHNLMVDELRRHSRRKDEQLDDRLMADQNSVPEQAQRAILFEQAQDSLAKLTDNQRAVVIMKFIEGMDNAEIALVMDMTVGAIKALQHRGLASLRRHLEDSGTLTED